MCHSAFGFVSHTCVFDLDTTREGVARGTLVKPDGEAIGIEEFAAGKLRSRKHASRTALSVIGAPRSGSLELP